MPPPASSRLILPPGIKPPFFASATETIRAPAMARTARRRHTAHGPCVPVRTISASSVLPPLENRIDPLINGLDCESKILGGIISNQYWCDWNPSPLRSPLAPPSSQLSFVPLFSAALLLSKPTTTTPPRHRVVTPSRRHAVTPPRVTPSPPLCAQAQTEL